MEGEGVVESISPVIVSRPERRGRSWSGIAESAALPFVWLLVIVFFGVMRPETFLSFSNFQSIFGTQAPLLVLAVAILLPLTAGDYDLSAASILVLSSLVVGILNVEAHWPIIFALLAAIAVGGVVGAINGFLIVILRVDSFIATLGMGTFLSGIALWISGSNTITGISTSYSNWTISNRWLGLSLMFYYGLGIMIVVWYVLEYTSTGRRMLFVGQNQNVARLSGVSVGRSRWFALIGAGVLSAVAGILYAGMLGAADPSSGLSFLLPAFAAAFLGATTIKPGRFNALGTFIAVYFLSTGVNGLTAMGASSFAQDLFYGGGLVVAVAAAQLVKRRGAA